MIVGERVRLRRAEPADVDFLVSLLTHEEVEPFLAAVRPKQREEMLERIERSLREPEDFGVFLIEVERDGAWHRAGIEEFERVNRRSRIAQLSGLALHPDFRGHGLADEAVRLFQRHLIFELGLHRLQAEVYGFNERAQDRTEGYGFVREGIRRNAYWRNEEWVDGVLYGLVREDLEQVPEERRGLDASTPLGAQVQRCLREETLVWLATASPGGRPLPTLVWFWWDGEAVWHYSRPRTRKLRNIASNPRVSLHFQTDPRGDHVSIVDGVAELARDAPPAHEVPGYLERYRDGIERLGMTPEEYGRTYSVAIRVEIVRVHGL